MGAPIKTTIKTLAASSVLTVSATLATAAGTVTVYIATPQNIIYAFVPMFEEQTGSPTGAASRTLPSLRRTSSA